MFILTDFYNKYRAFDFDFIQVSILTRSDLVIDDRPCHRLVAAFFVLREKYNSRFRPHVSDHARVSRCLNSRLLFFVAVIYLIRFIVIFFLLQSLSLS